MLVEGVNVKVSPLEPPELTIPPEQVRAPVEFVMVHPVAAEPPASRTSPVEVPPIEILPELLALIERLSLAPEEMTVRDSPPPAAAPAIDSPVATEAALALT